MRVINGLGALLDDEVAMAKCLQELEYRSLQKVGPMGSRGSQVSMIIHNLLVAGARSIGQEQQRTQFVKNGKKRQCSVFMQDHHGSFLQVLHILGERAYLRESPL